jgi:hypothetical protein
VQWRSPVSAGVEPSLRRTGTGTTPLERQQPREAAYGEIVRPNKEEETPPSRRLSSSGAALAWISRQRGSEPGQLAKLVRGELEWIVMRCLEKNRARRYEAASGLARDIERYLHDEPVEACPPKAGYRLRKFARTHQKLLVTAAAFVALLLLGVAISAGLAVRATQAEAVATASAVQAQKNEQEAKQPRDVAQKQRDEVRTLDDRLQRTLYASDMNLAQRAWEAGDIRRVRELLQRHRPNPGESDLRHFEWHYQNRLCHQVLLTLDGSGGPAGLMVYSPDGRRLATSTWRGRNAVVRVWDAAAGQEIHKLPAGGLNMAFSPDVRRIAGGGKRTIDVGAHRVPARSRCGTRRPAGSC